MINSKSATGNTSQYFIGREGSLTEIDKARHNFALLPLKGKGGIGKTTLLNEYKQQLLANDTASSNILCFDFDDYRYRTAFLLWQA